MRLVWHWLVLIVGLFVVTLVTPISYDRPQDLAWAALVLILVNTFIKPLLVLISLPLVLLTFGFFMLVINAVILKILPHLVHGFHVPGFFSAFFGAIVLSAITAVFGRTDRRAVGRRVQVRRVSSSRRHDKVIDI